jgi:hypothetical protein
MSKYINKEELLNSINQDIANTDTEWSLEELDTIEYYPVSEEAVNIDDVLDFIDSLIGDEDNEVNNTIVNVFQKVAEKFIKIEDKGEF